MGSHHAPKLPFYKQFCRFQSLRLFDWFGFPKKLRAVWSITWKENLKKIQDVFFLKTSWRLQLSVFCKHTVRMADPVCPRPSVKVKTCWAQPTHNLLLHALVGGAPDIVLSTLEGASFFLLSLIFGAHREGKRDQRRSSTWRKSQSARVRLVPAWHWVHPFRAYPPFPSYPIGHRFFSF